MSGLGNVVEEAMATKVSTIDECNATIESFSFPEDCVQYVINGIHELTGFNWWMSIVLTASMVSFMMSPVSMRIQIQAWKLQVLCKRVDKEMSVIQTYDPQVLAKYDKWLTVLFKKFGEAVLSFMNLFVLDAFIYISFINGIRTMAKKIPSFENGGIIWFIDLSTPSYILPLVTVFIFWFTSEVHFNRKNLLSRMKRLPLFLIAFIALQATYEFEPAVYLYLIPSRIYLSTLLLMVRSKQIVKFKSIMGWPNVPVTTTVSEQQMIMARVISLMREFVNEVKKKDKK